MNFHIPFLFNTRDKLPFKYLIKNILASRNTSEAILRSISILFISCTLLISCSVKRTNPISANKQTTKKFFLSGRITNCRDKSPVQGVIVKLTGDDNSSVETKTDKKGNYCLQDCFRSNVNYIITTNVTRDVGVGKEIKFGTCPYASTGSFGYINTSAKHKLKLSDTAKKAGYDFCLAEIVAEYRFPDFYFKNNSTEYFTPGVNGYITEDTTLDCFAGLLKAKKNWVIEISGNADSLENNPAELSEQRAKKIATALIKRGIKADRLIMKGYGARRMLKPENFYYEGKVPENTRVTMNVLRSDYGLNKNRKKSNIKKTKTSYIEEEEEAD